MNPNKSIFYHIRRAIIDPKTNKPISQAKYGKFLGYNKSTICINEKKGHKPSLKFAYAVAKTTGISLDYIAEKIMAPYLPDLEIKKHITSKMQNFLSQKLP